MFRSNKYTRQVLFACLFTVCFFVGYAALATVMRLWLVPAGFVACTAFAAVLLAAFGAVVRKGTRAMKGVTAEDGIVIYPDLLSFSGPALLFGFLFLPMPLVFRWPISPASRLACSFARFRPAATTEKKELCWRLSYSLHFLWWSRFWLSSSCA